LLGQVRVRWFGPLSRRRSTSLSPGKPVFPIPANSDDLGEFVFSSDVDRLNHSSLGAHKELPLPSLYDLSSMGRCTEGRLRCFRMEPM
jgi:hypothetical protein